MDKRAMFVLIGAGVALLLVVLLLRGPEAPAPSPSPAAAPPAAPPQPEFPLALHPARIVPAGTVVPTPVYQRPVDASRVVDATTAMQELESYTGGIAYLAPVVDEGTRYAFLQNKQGYALQLFIEGEEFGPSTYVKRIEDDRLVMAHDGQEQALPRRYKPYDARGTYFDPDTTVDPAKYAKGMEDYMNTVLPTLGGRPYIMMRTLEGLRAADHYQIDGGEGPGADARLPFAFKEDDVWFAFHAIAHAWGVVLDVSRPVDGKCAIPAGEYTLPEVLATVDKQCPTRSLVGKTRLVYVEYVPRALSAKQGGVVVDARLRNPIDRFYSPGSTVEFLLPQLAEKLKLNLDLSPQVQGKVRLNLRNTTGLEILEAMLPQVGAAYYIKDATLYVEPAAPRETQP